MCVEMCLIHFFDTVSGAKLPFICMKPACEPAEIGELKKKKKKSLLTKTDSELYMQKTSAGANVHIV